MPRRPNFRQVYLIKRRERELSDQPLDSRFEESIGRNDRHGRKKWAPCRCILGGFFRVFCCFAQKWRTTFLQQKSQTKNGAVVTAPIDNR